MKIFYVQNSFVQNCVYQNKPPGYVNKSPPSRINSRENTKIENTTKPAREEIDDLFYYSYVRTVIVPGTKGAIVKGLQNTSLFV